MGLHAVFTPASLGLRRLRRSFEAPTLSSAQRHEPGMSFSRDPTQPWRWNAVSSPETAIQRVPVTAPMASRDGTAPPLASRASPGRASPGRASPGRAALGRRDWQAPWERDAGPRAKGPPSPAGSLSSRLDRGAKDPHHAEASGTAGKCLK